MAFAFSAVCFASTTDTFGASVSIAGYHGMDV